jgi:hypothetical protein
MKHGIHVFFWFGFYILYNELVAFKLKVEYSFSFGEESDKF